MSKKLIAAFAGLASFSAIHGFDNGDVMAVEGSGRAGADNKKESYWQRAARTRAALSALLYEEMKAVADGHGLELKVVHDARQDYKRRAQEVGAFKNATKKELEDAARRYATVKLQISQRRECRNWQANVITISAMQQSLADHHGLPLGTIRAAYRRYKVEAGGGEAFTRATREELQAAAQRRAAVSKLKSAQRSKERRAAYTAITMEVMDWLAREHGLPLGAIHAACRCYNIQGRKADEFIAASTEQLQAAARGYEQRTGVNRMINFEALERPGLVADEQ